jgi:hypothetical protein
MIEACLEEIKKKRGLIKWKIIELVTM